MIGYKAFDKKIHGKLLNIVDFRYSVNKKGEVFSLFTSSSERNVIKKLNPFISSNKYMSVTLSKDNGIRKSFLVHRLVAYLFLNLDILNSKILINHKDFNKINNNLNNLEITTHSKNAKHWSKNRKKFLACKRQEK